MGIVGALLDLAYPRRCGSCGQAVLGEDMQICWDCRASLQVITDPYCDRCGDPVEGMIGHAFVCSMCRRHEPGFCRARSAVRYRGGICDALQSFKYRGQVNLGEDLANLLLACVRTHYAGIKFDAIGCVPLYPVRERTRSYNQSRLLAERVGRMLRLDLTPPRTVRRVRNTPSQTGLNSDERRDNVEAAFVVGQAEWLDGRTILLIDDVMTTGATVSACAGALREGGAAGVYVATVARG